MPVKSGSGAFTVTAAGDGEACYGVCLSTAGSGDRVRILTQGVTTMVARSGASWASHRRVCVAPSGQVDEGSDGDHWFGTLIYHDTDNNRATVLVHGDALPAMARGVRGADGTKYAFGSLTADQPIVLRTGRAESVRPIGTTAQRPSSPFNGQTYYDTDVGMGLVYDGSAWRSAALVEVTFAALRASITSNEMQFAGGQPSTDAGLPWIAPFAVTFTSAVFRLRGGTGGKTWTPSIRLDGSGSDDWAGSGRSSTTSWAVYREALSPVKSYVADARLRALATNGGTAENFQSELTLLGYYTP